MIARTRDGGDAGIGFGVGAARRRARQENFPVASMLIPPRYRRHLMRVYTFARLVDDIGDEAGAPAAAPTRAEQAAYRAAVLDSVDEELDLLFSGAEPTRHSFRCLAETVRTLDLPREPFDRLVRANRQDQLVARYETFDELAEYCTLSANPVGALVLEVFGMDRADRSRDSDRVCTALQLLEHSQDVAEDFAAGRVYLPAEDLRRFGVAESELAEPAASRAVRALVAFQVQRAVELLDAGAALVGSLRGAARVAVAGYVAGGLATAEALATAGFDVLSSTPRPTKARIAGEYTRLLATGAAR